MLFRAFSTGLHIFVHIFHHFVYSNYFYTTTNVGFCQKLICDLKIVFVVKKFICDKFVAINLCAIIFKHKSLFYNKINNFSKKIEEK